MAIEVLEIVKTGVGMSLQDLGRFGWRRFGVPPSGAMDPHAASWANRLLANAEDAPVLELLLQGAEVKLLADARVAITGADAGASVPTWHAQDLPKGMVISFPRNAAGLWTYLAVEGGFAAERVLGSASAYPRGGIGRTLASGDVLSADETKAHHVAGTAGAWVWWGERRDYNAPPLIKVWKGPQWDWFDEAERTCLLATDWEVSNRSDRVGYRLEGAELNPPEGDMQSEPVLAGSIQVPPRGQPIVTMRDGPTVGGYPKIALVDEASLPWLVQCRPGVKFRMELAG